MRIYIIGNDAITLCREPPATVNKGEIAAASGEELHTARLSGKRLLALWNALPGVEKRRKVGDRDALIDQLWSAIEALPGPDPQSDAKRPSKQEEVIAMLQRSSSVSSPRSTSLKISKKSEAFPEQSTRLPSRVGSSYQRRSSGACCPVSRLDALGSSVYKLLTLFARGTAAGLNMQHPMRSLPTAAGVPLGSLDADMNQERNMIHAASRKR